MEQVSHSTSHHKLPLDSIFTSEESSESEDDEVKEVCPPSSSTQSSSRDPSPQEGQDYNNKTRIRGNSNDIKHRRRQEIPSEEGSSKIIRKQDEFNDNDTHSLLSPCSSKTPVVLTQEQSV